jgi:rare lipoprotein A
MKLIKHAVLLVAIVSLSACATRWNESEPKGSYSKPGSETRTSNGELPRSRYGNPPLYEVFGKRYYVMDSSLDYKERGTASWYGKKFHGRKTSSGEIYNMHAFTAAHKSLPLPTDVRVTNLSNGKSIIVRVNDRGPFVGSRIIDMSYAAAKHLDMVKSGTAKVEVVALNSKPAYSPPPQLTATKPANTATSVVPALAPANTKLTAKHMFLQTGAFGAEENALQVVTKLADAGINNAFISPTTTSTAVLYRVRIGPLDGVAAYDDTVATLGALKINELQLVFEPAPAVREKTAALSTPVALND